MPVLLFIALLLFYNMVYAQRTVNVTMATTDYALHHFIPLWARLSLTINLLI